MKRVLFNLLILLTLSAVLFSYYSCGGKNTPVSTEADKTEITKTATDTPEHTETGAPELTEEIITGESGTSPVYTPTPEEFFKPSVDEETGNVTLSVNTDTEYPVNIVVPSVYGGKPVTKFKSVHVVRLVNVELSEDEWYIDQYGYLIKNRTEMQTFFQVPERAKSLYIPKSVTYIDLTGYGNCTLLDEIIFENPDGWAAFIYDYTKNAYIKCAGIDLSALEDPYFAAKSIKELEKDIPSVCLSNRDLTGEQDPEAPRTASPDDPPEELYVFAAQNDGKMAITGTKNVKFPETLVLPQTYLDRQITTISKNALSKLEGVKHITVPDGYTTIGNSAFYSCPDLESVELPDSVVNIGSAFSYCSSLKTVNIPKNLTQLSAGAFRGCVSLERVTVPDGCAAFYTESGCLISRETMTLMLGLSGCTVPDGVVTVGDSAFISRSGQTVVLPDSVKTVDNYAFCSCADLKSVVLPEGLQRIGTMAFAECASLTDITVYGNVTNLETAAFLHCSALKTAVLSNGVSVIGTGVFFNCKALEEVTVPASVSYIGPNAFGNCVSLQTVRYEGTVEQWKNIQKGAEWNAGSGEFKVYCTDGTLVYKDA